MSYNNNKCDDLWVVQVSIANEAAKLPNPSLAQLHHEVLEEIGRPPSQDLVDYFIASAGISADEAAKYNKCIGRGVRRGNSIGVEENIKKQLADSIACAENPTVLKFRRTFAEQFGALPSEKLTQYFLGKIRNASGAQKNKKDNDQGVFNFADKFATSLNPTVLRFREEFIDQYGMPPTDEVIKYFLEKIRIKREPRVEEEEHMCRINFAATVANGLIPTVLQFRKTYESIYGESPSTEIIGVFIAHLPSKGQ
jgi:hypothetical protein